MYTMVHYMFAIYNIPWYSTLWTWTGDTSSVGPASEFLEALPAGVVQPRVRILDGSLGGRSPRHMTSLGPVGACQLGQVGHGLCLDASLHEQRPPDGFRHSYQQITAK